MIAQHFIDIQQKRKPDPADCKEIKMKLLLAERIILNVLSFDLIVEQPYNTIITLSQSLKVSDEVQCAWRFANDSIYSTASIQYTAKTIAAACVYLAIRVLKKMPPENAVPTLLDMCGTDEAVLMRCCDCLKALYPNFDKQFLCRVCSKERKKEKESEQASRQINKQTSKQ
ncbi:uncharacterized protein [Blastocystis hominis]|uniref:Cyclin C-terminal domain-containing protein n=1 Tax=Blastocystis hominis TaxID=12968 RepID=D8LUW7_BLAHO|nr:uncharacterized protein [Blastocystis hominis]CBK19606.2 unnamed protein product [Blastocystis hominis]|eukprot:XP_012893654.1 uncharacterized protein [Blastocystis hominis]